ncbi:hypothetical protein EDD15DRAFT_2200352 [Pisolithus albus]|nr:hypothetical protein EDD15DRAFT_2200352 [Pisolithus albus]
MYGIPNMKLDECSSTPHRPDGSQGPQSSVVQARPSSKAAACAQLLRAHSLGNVRLSREPGQALYGGSAQPEQEVLPKKLKAPFNWYSGLEKPEAWLRAEGNMGYMPSWGWGKDEVVE